MEIIKDICIYPQEGKTKELKFMKTIKRDFFKAKPRGANQVRFLREYSLTQLIKRCKAIEEHYDYAEPIYKVLPVFPAGDVVQDQIYYECKMVFRGESL